MKSEPMLIPRITSTHDEAIATLLSNRIDNKTKPIGSLGRLESLARQIGLIQQTGQPRIVAPQIMVFAGDHGVAAEDVSAYPQSVTWQMVENFLMQGAAINVFALQSGCDLVVVDAGVNHDFGEREGLTGRKIGFGTRNFAKEPAMRPDECAKAIGHGRDLVAAVNGNVIGFGEMGIGNTSSAAALMHKLTGYPVSACVGAGTGLSAEKITHKQHIIEQAVLQHAGASEPLDVLATFGGFEIAMMVGAMLEAAARRKVLLIDGFISTSALLVAFKLQPDIIDYCVFAHCSEERGHQLMLDHLHGTPLLHLGMRLGEGSGAALAVPLLLAAVNFLHDMASFDSANVSQKTAA
jgi:nicotinate-nucleotide--dimethylbenzimidazole phosphoribosyltransferase